MSSASNKKRLFAYLLAAFYLLPAAALAETTGVVSSVGTGRDAGEAIANLLTVTLAKHFKEQPPALVRAVLQSEILPNASSFVQSYKILEGGRAGAVSLSASVDLDVISGLMSLSPKSLGEPEGAKALVVVRGAKLPDAAVSGMKQGAVPADPFGVLAASSRERLSRRGFDEATLTVADLQALGAGDDMAGPEFLRGMGSKAGARIVLGISGRFESYENENSHNKDERLVLTATLVDVKAGSVITKASVNVVSPKSRREQYIADLQRSIAEESKDLFQDVFVSAGRRLARPEGHSGFSVVRVQFPSNGILVQKFRTLLEAVPGVRSVTEYNVTRGKFDLAVRPALAEPALAKAVAGMQSPEISVAVFQTMSSEEPAGVAQPPVLTVKISPKEALVPTEGVPPNAKR